MPDMTPEEFGRHLLRGLTCTAGQRFYDDAAKDIAGRDAAIRKEARAIEQALRSMLEMTPAERQDPAFWHPRVTAAIAVLDSLSAPTMTKISSMARTAEEINDDLGKLPYEGAQPKPHRMRVLTAWAAEIRKQVRAACARICDEQAGSWSDWGEGAKACADAIRASEIETIGVALAAVRPAAPAASDAARQAAHKGRE